MTRITANRSTTPPTTPPTIAAMLIVVVMPVIDVGDGVPDVPVVDALDRGKIYVEGTKASYLVPPSTRNTSKDSRRTGSNSEL